MVDVVVMTAGNTYMSKEIMQNDEEPASICTVYAHLQQVYDGRLRCGHCASHCKTRWSTDLL